MTTDTEQWRRLSLRLLEIAGGIADRDWSKLVMSIPARPEHDADLVTSSAADALREAADTVDRLNARVAELEQWQRDMVAKAAEQSLDGYRELGARAAAAENTADELRERIATLERQLEVERTGSDRLTQGAVGYAGEIIRLNERIATLEALVREAHALTVGSFTSDFSELLAGDGTVFAPNCDWHLRATAALGQNDE